MVIMVMLIQETVNYVLVDASLVIKIALILVCLVELIPTMQLIPDIRKY
jgi:uncharacterized membrane protein